MKYQEIHPSPPLDQFVECFWTLESDPKIEVGQTERILPDGCAEIILNYGERFRQHHNSNDAQLQPRQFLVGQITAPMVISPNGVVRTIGIRFHPGGTSAFFRFGMEETTNRVLNLADLDADWLGSIDDLGSFRDQVRKLEKALLTHLLQSKPDMVTLKLASIIVETHGLISLDRLASQAGISGRQMERRFLREVGIGPKMLCRILRFQLVFKAFERDHPSWAPIAVECGYYDQAHLIRDFRAFSSQTPAALFSHRSPLTDAFTGKDRMSNFSKTSLRTII